MKNRPDNMMWGRLIELSPRSDKSLQRQLREQLVSAILGGHISTDQPLPSSRELARNLDIARNTVVLAYQCLVDEGFLLARERSGFYVNGEILSGLAREGHAADTEEAAPPDWERRFKFKPSTQRNITKPQNWDTYEYPFIYGQPDAALTPINDWRECCREALSVSSIQETARDLVDHDEPLLVEQIINRVLPRRGIWAEKDQLLVTMGAQQALYLLANLLIGESTRVGMEDPGYPDARNIFRKHSSQVVGLPVDDDGLIVKTGLGGCDYLYVTPSHQSPTTVTMSIERRTSLLQQAAQTDCLIIEDDYENETNYLGPPTPALKSLDRNDRVLYIGSLSKTLAPGLRVGYLVGPPALIREARALRRLMVRHPPANNQRIIALFLSLGHYDSLIHRLTQSYHARWLALGEALTAHFPNSFYPPTFGGTSYWIRGPANLDAEELLSRALKEGIVFEPGNVFFLSDDPPKNYFRLGFSSIPSEHIEPGIRKLTGLINA